MQDLSRDKIVQEDSPIPPVSLYEIFREFLFIGGTSFGGGVIAYLHSGLVIKRAWVDDKTFVELLSISQSLPGLNSTNMAVLVGDRLRGVTGAAVALVAICLPGALFMLAVGLMYQEHGNRPIVSAMLKGVAAAAIGMILATAIQLGRRSLGKLFDLFFVALTVVCVHSFHVSVPRALLGVGALAILWYRPRATSPVPTERGALS